MTLALTIESMAYGGKGIGRVDGKVYFVADAIPGDVAEVEIVNSSDRYAEAIVHKLVQPSPLRGAARCPYSSTNLQKEGAACGGCQWMGIDDARQLEWKRGFVESALKRIGKLGETPVEILPSPLAFGYRNRILVRAHLAETGVLQVGYFQRSSRNLVPIGRCDIAAEPINALIEALTKTNWQPLPALKARIEFQEIPPVDGKNLIVTVYPGDDCNRTAVKEFTDRIKPFPHVYWAGLVFDLRDAPAVRLEQDLGLDFLTIPGQFQQVNVAHNQTLRRLVKEKTEALAPKRVLDVFCGSGNLSLPLAQAGRYVEGVEANRQAIDVAKRNVEANGLVGTCYIAGDAEKHLWKCDRGGEKFDLIILDPPRQGMYKGMVPLKNIAPPNIIYVSCDPTTLARDLGYLCRTDGYVLERVVALDFFPHTFHVETVAFLRLTK